MTRSTSGWSDSVSRRSVLAAGLVGAVGATSGCIDRVQSATGQGPTNQLTLTISTVPADDDREAIQIARSLQANLEAVGVDVSIDVRSRTEFLERILIENDFDVFVGRQPVPRDPDALYEALHSTFTHEAGWQNPYGFTSLSFDGLLEEQRHAEGDDREAAVERLLGTLAAEKPFEPICIPEEYRVGRTDRFSDWSDGHLASRHGYLEVTPADGVSQLLATVTDDLPTRHVDPVSAEFRQQPMMVDLVYDSLATVNDGEREPWLAEHWSWSDGGIPESPHATDSSAGREDGSGEYRDGSDDYQYTAGDTDSSSALYDQGIEASNDPARDSGDDSSSMTATVDLREKCRFHDGRRVSANDVVFSYRFLSDATMGRGRSPSRPPRFRGRLSAVEAIERLDDYRVAIEVSTSAAVGERALDVPILPEHIWRERVERRFQGFEHATGAGDSWGHLEMSNVPPVGSGPYQVADRSGRDYLALERFDEHFTLRRRVDLAGPGVQSLRFEVDPGSAASMGRIDNGTADVTASPIQSHVIDDVPGNGDLERFESTPRSLFVVGFNARSRPCSNTHFRRAVTQLIDRERFVDTVFEGHAEPVTTPLAEEWVPEDLTWSGDDPVTPFPETDGELDVDEAKTAFERAGYRYDDQERLLEGY